MSLSMHQAAVPAFVQLLTALTAILEKAEAHAASRKIDPSVLINARLFPDMLPLARQVAIACDFAKGATARLAGTDVPSWPDDEKTFDQLRQRIRKTLDFVQSFKVAQIDGSEDRDITISIAGKPLTLKGQPYLVHFVLPNFYFHVSIAYGLLRHNGVELGKRDFVGQVPGWNP
jgi:uncharacterized protein